VDQSDGQNRMHIELSRICSEAIGRAYRLMSFMSRKVLKNRVRGVSHSPISSKREYATKNGGILPSNVDMGFNRLKSKIQQSSLLRKVANVENCWRMLNNTHVIPYFQVCTIRSVYLLSTALANSPDPNKEVHTVILGKSVKKISVCGVSYSPYRIARGPFTEDGKILRTNGAYPLYRLRSNLIESDMFTEVQMSGLRWRIRTGNRLGRRNVDICYETNQMGISRHTKKRRYFVVNQSDGHIVDHTKCPAKVSTWSVVLAVVKNARHLWQCLVRDQSEPAIDLYAELRRICSEPIRTGNSSGRRIRAFLVPGKRMGIGVYEKICRICREMLTYVASGEIRSHMPGSVERVREMLTHVHPAPCSSTLSVSNSIDRPGSGLYRLLRFAQYDSVMSGMSHMSSDVKNARHVAQYFSGCTICREMLDMFRKVGAFLHRGGPYSFNRSKRGVSTEVGEKMFSNVAYSLSRLKATIQKSYMLRDVKNVEKCWICRKMSSCVVMWLRIFRYVAYVELC